MPRALMAPQDFVDLWNSCDSIDEFLSKTDFSYYGATGKASHLRKAGWNVKKFEIPLEKRKQISAKGGRSGTTGGFYVNRELARTAGAKGGRISKRGKRSS